MTTVVLGSNRFVDCSTLIAVQQHELLRITTAPLRISLTTPPDVSTERAVHVEENQRGSGSEANVRVVASDTSVAVFWGENPLAIATLLDDTTVSLHLDLRPVGIDLFADALGLHIGKNVFTGNQITSVSTAIALR